jgi:hypothetical protein
MTAAINPRTRQAAERMQRHPEGKHRPTVAQPEKQMRDEDHQPREHRAKDGDRHHQPKAASGHNAVNKVAKAMPMVDSESAPLGTPCALSWGRTVPARSTRATG